MIPRILQKKKKIVLLASGRGSNLEAVLKEIRSGNIQGEAVSVISENPEARALELAKSYNIPGICIPFTDFKGRRKDFDITLNETLLELNPDLIVTAGYMKIISSITIRSFPNRIINIHPSLLPAFPGIHSQKQALEYGAKITGCTVHFVDEGVDSGPVIMQSAVEIKPGMDLKSLTLAILREEHKILPLAVKLFCENKLKIEGRNIIHDSR